VGRDSEDFAAPPPTTPAAVAQKLDTPDGGTGDSEAH